MHIEIESWTMERALKISVVSYLNASPFVYGLEHAGQRPGVDFFLDNPAVCAQKLFDNQVDVGLVPVAVIPELKNASIVSDYCIGAEREVLSVLLVSPLPLSQIDCIYLDQESRTSVMLLRVLMQRFWKINPVLLPLQGEPTPEQSCLLIGDKSFVYQSQYSYCYDLSEVWFEMTGLPFVFACWVANKSLPDPLLKAFNQSLLFGIEHVREMTEENVYPDQWQVDVLEYLTRHISYTLDQRKKEALHLFWEMTRSLGISSGERHQVN